MIDRMQQAVPAGRRFCFCAAPRRRARSLRGSNADAIRNRADLRESRRRVRARRRLLADGDDGRALSRLRRRHRRGLARLFPSPSRRGADDARPRKLWHTSNLFQIPEGERLARRLVDATFADLVFFTNSGAEANEAAVKMARKRQSVGGHPEKYRILTFEGAFHGRTLAMIAAGGQAKYIEGFGPKVDGFDQIPPDDLDAVEAAIGPGTGAIMIEPIQGEGGVRVDRAGVPARACARCATSTACC